MHQWFSLKEAEEAKEKKQQGGSPAPSKGREGCGCWSQKNTGLQLLCTGRAPQDPDRQPDMPPGKGMTERMVPEATESLGMHGSVLAKGGGWCSIEMQWKPKRGLCEQGPIG